MRRFKRMSFSTPCSAAVVFVLLAWPMGDATGQTFTGDGDGTSWNDSNNWDSGIVPGATGDNNPVVEITNQPDVRLDAPTTLSTVNQSLAELFINFNDSVLSVNAPSQLDSIAGNNWLRSTVNVNADLDTRASMSGGVLNLNSGELSGALSLLSGAPSGGGGFPPFGGGASGPATVNRNGGTLNLDALSVSGEPSAPGVIDLLGSDTVATATAGENGVLNVDGASITSGLSINAGGTANLNAGAFDGVHRVDGGTLNLNGGTLAGRLRLNNFVDSVRNPSGMDPTFIQNGGTLDLVTLDAIGNVAVDINSTDNVRGNIEALSGAQITINRDLTLERLVPGTNFFNNASVIAGQGSTVFLNADILESSTVSFFGDSLQRADGVSINTITLDVNSANYTYDGTDTISSNVRITDGALTLVEDLSGATVSATRSTVAVDTESNLLNLGGSDQSTINVNQATNVSNVVSVTADSVLNVNADLQAGSTNGTRSFGGTINLNDSTLRGRLQLLDGTAGEVPVLNRDGGILELYGLNVEDGNDLDLLAGDSIANDIVLREGSNLDVFTALDLNSLVGLDGGSTLNVFQSVGQLNGLAAEQLGIDAGSMLNLNFDVMLAAEDELDFALRLNGDAVAQLESFIAGGQLTFTGPASTSIGVIRDIDRFGNFTYVGYIGTSAVPEPSSLSLMIVGTLAIAGRRRRRRS